MAAPPACAAGFQYGTAPDPDDKPIELAIWYPSDAPLTEQPLGLFKQNVAYYGAIKGSGLPLVVISHGAVGSAAAHYDTALALADAGFVVVALNHTGDNYKDRSHSYTARNFIDRPRHVSRVMDFMLNSWDGHDHLDPTRIGMFGHSAGAVTALILMGGNPDLYLAVLFCRDHPDALDCQQAKQATDSSGNESKERDWTWSDWHHDPRIKAAVIATPGIGYTFTKIGLETVAAPIQLWRGENDKFSPNAWNSDIIEGALPQPPEDHLVAKAGHLDFLAPCNEAMTKIAPEICESEAGFDRAAFHQDMNRAAVGFFKAQLGPTSP